MSHINYENKQIRLWLPAVKI